MDTTQPGFFERLLPKFEGGTIEDSDAPGTPDEITGARVDGDMIVIETNAGWSFTMKKEFVSISAGRDEKTLVIHGMGLSATVVLP